MLCGRFPPWFIDIASCQRCYLNPSGWGNLSCLLVQQCSTCTHYSIAALVRHNNQSLLDEAAEISSQPSEENSLNSCVRELIHHHLFQTPMPCSDQQEAIPCVLDFRVFWATQRNVLTSAALLSYPAFNFDLRWCTCVSKPIKPCGSYSQCLSEESHSNLSMKRMEIRHVNSYTVYKCDHKDAWYFWFAVIFSLYLVHYGGRSMCIFHWAVQLYHIYETIRFCYWISIYCGYSSFPHRIDIAHTYCYSISVIPLLIWQLCLFISMSKSLPLCCKD